MHRCLAFAFACALSACALGASAQTIDPHQLGLLQSVQLLEMKLFGRTFFGEPILKRINRLEDVVGLSHPRDKGSLARVDAVEKEVPKTPADWHKAAARAINAENVQTSEKMWQNLSVIGVAVKVIDVAVNCTPPPAVREEFETWRAQFTRELQRGCTAALASALAHSFGSIKLGAEAKISLTIQNNRCVAKLEHSSGYKELDDCANFASAVPTPLPQPPLAICDTPVVVSVTLQAIKQAEAQPTN